MVLEREGLHLERRRQEASSKVVQRQHRVLLSWVRDDAGRQTSSAIIPHGRASRTLGKNRFMCQMTDRKDVVAGVAMDTTFSIARWGCLQGAQAAPRGSVSWRVPALLSP